MPTYVILLLVVLVWIGARRLETQTLPVVRLLVAPAVFIALGVFNLFAHTTEVLPSLGVWAAGAALGALPGAAFSQPIAVDRVQGLVRVPGSFAPLARILVLFALHFGCHAVAAVRPDMASSALTLDLGVYGLGVGYFGGWLARFVQAYTSAPDTDLGGSRSLARA